jgi:uncharacterized protein (DUF302 family)
MKDNETGCRPMDYYITRMVSGGFDEVRERAIAALKDEGFGVLTEINVKDTLKTKIGVDFRPYTILGACNPKLAHRALSAEDKVGVLLPCNVVVQERGAAGVEVSAMDPSAAMSMIDNAEVSAVASEVREKLDRVLKAI